MKKRTKSGIKMAVMSAGSVIVGWGGYFWSMREFKKGNLLKGTLLGAATAISSTLFAVIGSEKAAEWTFELLKSDVEVKR